MKWIWSLLVLMQCTCLFGQGEENYYFLGSTGHEAIVGVEVRNEGLICFGSTGKNDQKGSDIWIVKTDTSLATVEFFSIGTYANERLVDYWIDTMTNEYYFLVSYYSAFSGDGYQCELWRLDSTLTSIEEVRLELSNVEPKVLRFDSVEQDLIVLCESLENDSIHVSTHRLGNISQYSEYSMFVLGLESIDDLLIEDLRLTFLLTKNTDTTNKNILLLVADRNFHPSQSFEIGDSLDDIGASITLNTDSTWLIAGSSQNLYSTSDFNAFVASVTFDGNLVWQRAHGYNLGGNYKDDFSTRADVLTDGRILLGITTKTYGLGEEDYHLYLLNPEGYYITGNSYGTSNSDVLFDFDYPSFNGNVLTAGVTRSLGNGGDDILLVIADTIKFGLNKSQTIILDSSMENTLNIRETTQETSVCFYKDGHLNLTSMSGILQVSIYSLNGSLLYQRSFNGSDSLAIPFSAESDVFLVGVKTENGEVFSRVINQKL